MKTTLRSRAETDGAGRDVAKNIAYPSVDYCRKANAHELSIDLFSAAFVSLLRPAATATQAMGMLLISPPLSSQAPSNVVSILQFMRVIPQSYSPGSRPPPAVAVPVSKITPTDTFDSQLQRLTSTSSFRWAYRNILHPCERHWPVHFSRQDATHRTEDGPKLFL